jgi:ABC-type multidrug transport system ATPase subunit
MGPRGDTDHIQVRGLRRTYGTGDGAFEAVRDIDLVVGAGTIPALLGTNGTGKTSALEVVEGLQSGSMPQLPGDRTVNHRLEQVGRQRLHDAKDRSD